MIYPIKLGYYRHFKGNIYCVYGVIKHTETREPLVVYGEEGRLQHGRPYEMFLEDVEIEGKNQPRFKYLDQLPGDPGFEA